MKQEAAGAPSDPHTRVAQAEVLDREDSDPCHVTSREAAAAFVEGERLYKEGRFEPAAAAFERAAGLQPDFACAIDWLGLCLQSLEHYDEAAVAFERSIAVNPRRPESRMNLGGLYLALGEWARAATVLEQARDLDPNDAAVYVDLGIAYMQLDRPDDSLRCCGSADSPRLRRRARPL